MQLPEAVGVGVQAWGGLPLTLRSKRIWASREGRGGHSRIEKCERKGWECEGIWTEKEQIRLTNTGRKLIWGSLNAGPRRLKCSGSESEMLQLGPVIKMASAEKECGHSVQNRMWRWL